jgi:hypothetical protein
MASMKRLRARVVTVSLAFILVPLGLASTQASATVTAGVPAPYVTPNNASDPHAKPCTLGGQAGVCLYVSHDMDGTTAPGGNGYAMDATNGWFSTDGINWSGPTPLLNEKAYVDKGWTPSGADHLWAPSAAQGPDGNWYLYVPDITNVNAQHTSSFIGVSKGPGPLGPFVPQAQIFGSSSVHGGYASDPDVISSGGQNYLAYANGDGSNCGSLSIAQLNSSMTGFATTPQPLNISGVPTSIWGTNCSDPNNPVSLYMEGPHLYNTSSWPAGAQPAGGPFLLLVPIQPKNVPPECMANVQAQPGKNDELIAYATSPTVTGTYSYRGILMCGSQSEFTDQASLIPITRGSNRPLILIYHDGHPDSTGHHRTIHAECLPYGAGIFPGSIRTGGTTFAQSGAIHDCLGTFDPNMIGLRSSVTGQYLSGNGTLVANRYAIGPWEHFHMFTANGAPIPASAGSTQGVSFPGATWQADANGLFVTGSSQTVPLKSDSSTPGAAQQYNPNFSGSASGTEVFFYAPTGRGVRTNPSTSQLLADVDPFGAQESFTVMHY